MPEARRTEGPTSRPTKYNVMSGAMGVGVLQRSGALDWTINPQGPTGGPSHSHKQGFTPTKLGPTPTELGPTPTTELSGPNSSGPAAKRGGPGAVQWSSAIYAIGPRHLCAIYAIGHSPGVNPAGHSGRPVNQR